MQTLKQPHTILIADDDFIARKILKLILKNLLLMVREAENGMEALSQLQMAGDKPVILLLDLNMPVKSGYEVLQEMVDNPNTYTKVKTIVVSSALADQFVHTGFENHIHSYMEKPVKPEAWIKEIMLLMA